MTARTLEVPANGARGAGASVPAMMERLAARRAARAGAAIAALALALRLLHLRLGAKLLLADDAEFFEQHARQFLDAWAAIGTPDFGARLRLAVDESSLQGVLYPWFESLVYLATGGVQHEALGIVQVALGTLTVWLTYLTGRRAFGPAAGVAAGLLAAVYTPLIVSTGQLLAESLLTTVQAAALYLLVRGLVRGAWRSRMLAGACTGLLMLRPAFQYSGVLLAGALALAGALQALERATGRAGAAGTSREFLVYAARRAAALALPYLAGVLLVAVPWVAMNGLVFGQVAWSRTGDAWHQVYWGIYPPNHGWWPPDSPVPPKYGVESLPGARSAGQQIEERDIDYFWAAVDQVRATPVKAFATEVNKLYQGYLHPSDTYGEHPPLVWWTAVPLHRLMELLALAGLCFGWVRAAWRPAWLVLGAGWLASALPFLASHVDLRYTIPPSQLAALFAGAALTWLLASLRHLPEGAGGERFTSAIPLLCGASLALPLLVWAIDVQWLLAVAPGAAPWTLHLLHTAGMCAAFVVAGHGAASLLRPALGTRGRPGVDSVSAAGLLLGGAIALVYSTQALYEGDWHQWTVQLQVGDAVRQTFVLPSGWQPPTGGRAEARLYVQGSPTPDYEPVISINGLEAARLGPAMSESGPLRFWEKIMVAARNKGLSRPEVPQWIAVPVDLDALRGSSVVVDVAVQPSVGTSTAPGVTVWGDYAPRPAPHLYEGPAAYSRIQGQDEAFLKFIATGEYGIWRWQPLASAGTQAAVRSHATGGEWRSGDLSPDAPGVQTGEYRIRLLVYGPGGDLAAMF